MAPSLSLWLSISRRLNFNNICICVKYTPNASHTTICAISIINTYTWYLACFQYRALTHRQTNQTHLTHTYTQCKASERSVAQFHCKFTFQINDHRQMLEFNWLLWKPLCLWTLCTENSTKFLALTVLWKEKIAEPSIDTINFSCKCKTPLKIHGNSLNTGWYFNYHWFLDYFISCS